ncbi:MAG: Uma2 family endonuclease [Acidobacteriota bacterium]|nr:Uma2 family endonuclease [Acidobacteriota bacterium]
MPEYPPYRYPDLTAYCGEGNFEKVSGLDILTSPQMIIEVLSDSTEGFDRGDKFTYYKSIESFVEYILVSTKRPHITQFFKNENGDWINRDFEGIETTFHSPTFDAEIYLAEIYLNVEFPPFEDNLFEFER